MYDMKTTGPVLVPDDEGYDEERAGFQAAMSHRPSAIVGAVNADDVAAAVRFAGSRGLPVGVKSSGHGIAAPTEGGVLISTTRMAGITIDGTDAWIEAGVPWGKVVEAAAPHGLAPLSGSAVTVGAIGYTLAGGIGLLARKHGFAVDHVSAIDVVTADGELHHVTADSDPDLFWALRGGRDNFGVVTGLRVGLAPMGQFYGGGLFFDADLVETVLSTWQDWTTTLPDEMTTSLSIQPFPPIPRLPEQIRGHYAAHVRIAYQGDPESGEALIAPLRAIGPRLLDTVAEMPFTECGTIHNDSPQPIPFAGTNALLGGLTKDVQRTILELAGRKAAVPCIVELRHLGGALARPAAVPSAIGFRDAPYMMVVVSRVADNADEILAVHDAVFEGMRPWTVGRNLNFLGNGQPTSDAFEPDDYQRLSELKSRYDPTNMFRMNFNIPPA